MLLPRTHAADRLLRSMPPAIAAGAYGSQRSDAGDIHPLRDHGGMGIAIWLKGMRPQTLPASVGRGRGMDFRPTARRMRTDLPRAGILRNQSCHAGHVGIAVLAVGDPVHAGRPVPADRRQLCQRLLRHYSDGVRGVDEGRGAASPALPASPASSSSAVPTGTPPVAVVLSGRRDGIAATSIHAPARLVASGVPPKRVLTSAGTAAALACLCGLAIVVITGHWWLLAVGVCCLLAGWCYRVLRPGGGVGDPVRAVRNCYRDGGAGRGAGRPALLRAADG